MQLDKFYRIIGKKRSAEIINENIVHTLHIPKKMNISPRAHQGQLIF